MQSSSTQPLSGVRVIDFTQVMLGPSATQVLADYGADVIKIERPGAGDLSRSSIPGDPDGLDNPVFRSLNRNKRSIALDASVTVDRVDIRKLQARLRAQGADPGDQPAANALVTIAAE